MAAPERAGAVLVPRPILLGGVFRARGTAQNLAAVGSFGVAYMSVIILEPLADLAVLAAAKTLTSGSRSLLLYNRLHHGAN